MSTDALDAKSGEFAEPKPENPYLATFRPYIPAGVRIREFTANPIMVGTLLGMVFGASSLYLVLKTGLTVSASIPVAVISITLFRSLANPLVRRIASIIVIGAGVLGLFAALKTGLPTIGILGLVALLALIVWIIWTSRGATILENNIVQTAGSAGESIAFGVGVTM